MTAVRCMSDCPANVDMATSQAQLLAQALERTDEEGASR